MARFLLVHEERGPVGYVDDDPFEVAYDGPEAEVAEAVNEAAVLIDTAHRPGPELDMNTGPRPDDPTAPLSNARKAVKFAASFPRKVDGLETRQLEDDEPIAALDVDAPVVVRHDVSRFTGPDDGYLAAKAREFAAVLPESEAELREQLRAAASEYGLLAAGVRELRAERDAWTFIEHGPDRPPYLEE